MIGRPSILTCKLIRDLRARKGGILVIICIVMNRYRFPDSHVLFRYYGAQFSPLRTWELPQSQRSFDHGAV